MSQSKSLAVLGTLLFVELLLVLETLALAQCDNETATNTRIRKNALERCCASDNNMLFEV